MRRGATGDRWRGMPVLCVALLLACAVAKASAGEPPRWVLSSSEARKWLARIHTAAHSRNYQGVLVFSADGNLSSSRVAHFGDGTNSYERVEALDGTAQLSYRHNDRVVTLWPKSRVAVIEERDPLQGSLRQVIEPRAEEQYEMSVQGDERVAGRDAQVLLLSPRDDSRFAQRLWIDSQTGLILRADVLDAQQQVLESSAFSEVEIGIKARPEIVLQPLKKLDGYRVVRPAQKNTRLESEGWVLNSPPSGFTLASCSRRALDPASAELRQEAALQAVYSDGLTHVSVFVEPLDPRRHRQPLQTRMGAMNTLMQPYGGEWWITLMGDVPPATLQRFYRSLERRR